MLLDDLLLELKSSFLKALKYLYTGRYPWQYLKASEIEVINYYMQFAVDFSELATFWCANS